MLISDIALYGGQRETLFAIKQNDDVFNETQNRLTSGKKVNVVTDDAVSFFEAKQYNEKAVDLITRKEEFSQAISSLKVATTTIDSVESLTKQMRSVLETISQRSGAERDQALEQFNELAQQITNLTNDAIYQGMSLVGQTDNNLSLYFDKFNDSKLEISPVKLNGGDETATDSRIFSDSVYDNKTGAFLGLESFDVNLPNFNIDEIEALTAGNINSFKSKKTNIYNSSLDNNSAGQTIKLVAVRGDYLSQPISGVYSKFEKLTITDLYGNKTTLTMTNEVGSGTLPDGTKVKVSLDNSLQKLVQIEFDTTNSNYNAKTLQAYNFTINDRLDARNITIGDEPDNPNLLLTGIERLNKLIEKFDNAIDQLDKFAKTFASHIETLKDGIDFNSIYITQLEIGSDDLTLTDLNEDGVYMVALQTRQQLAVGTLSIAAQQQKSALILLDV